MRGMLWRASKVCHLPPEKRLEPGVEIHRRRVRRHADVAEISVAVARRNVHAAAERDRKMREIAAYADAFGVGFIGGARRTGALIAERDVAIDEIADRLHPRPARRRMAEMVPGDLAEFVGFDVAAADEIEQRVVRQIRHRDFSGVDGTTGSGRPLTSMTPALEIVRSPEGALNLRQRLPNTSA